MRSYESYDRTVDPEIAPMPVHPTRCDRVHHWRDAFVCTKVFSHFLLLHAHCLDYLYACESEAFVSVHSSPIAYLKPHTILFHSHVSLAPDILDDASESSLVPFASNLSLLMVKNRCRHNLGERQLWCLAYGPDLL